jgi:hypothetical protein
MQVPRLDLGAYRNRLALMRETEAFCKDPANLMLEKHFMIRRFYAGLAEEARKAFNLARMEAERWLRIALDPIMTRIREHKQYLDTRLASLQRFWRTWARCMTAWCRSSRRSDAAPRQGRTKTARIGAQLAV